MGKPRPTEIRLVANLIDPDATNPEGAADMAIEIIEALDLSRVKRESYIVVAQLASWVPIQAWGEFNTKLQAQKLLASLSAPGPGGGKGAIARLEDPGTYRKRMGE